MWHAEHMVKTQDELPVSIRMSPELRVELDAIASANKRSRNNTILLLLERGIAAYKMDGKLLEPMPSDNGARHRVPVVQPGKPIAGQNRKRG